MNLRSKRITPDDFAKMHNPPRIKLTKATEKVEPIIEENESDDENTQYIPKIEYDLQDKDRNSYLIPSGFKSKIKNHHLVDT